MNYETQTIVENGIEYEIRVFQSGTKEWFLNGKLHREDGPAAEWANGDKFWFLNGKRHRDDGPAAEWANGDKEWWLNREKIDSYFPSFGCFTPKTREEALKRLNSKDRPYSYDLYMKDINEMFPVKG